MCLFPPASQTPHSPRHAYLGGPEEGGGPIWFNLDPLGKTLPDETENRELPDRILHDLFRLILEENEG